MKNNKLIGISLIALSLLMIIAMIVNNHILWLFADLLVIFVSGIIGIVLIGSIGKEK